MILPQGNNTAQILKSRLEISKITIDCGTIRNREDVGERGKGWGKDRERLLKEYEECQGQYWGNHQ
jgi:hypothetical protein